MAYSNSDASRQEIYRDNGRGVGMFVGGLAGLGALGTFGILNARNIIQRAARASERAAERGMQMHQKEKLIRRYAQSGTLNKIDRMVTKPFAKVIKNPLGQSAAVYGSAAVIGGGIGAMLDNPYE